MFLSTLERLPGLRLIVSPIRRWRASRRFAGQYAAFNGVFASREAAERSAPRSRPLGSASEVLVGDYATLLETQLAHRGLESYEYPVLFWLSTLIERGDVRVVADFGGNLGTHYHAYARYLEYPRDFAWHIVDVPPIVHAGRELAHARGAGDLHFTTTITDVSECDLLLASGSFQYLDDVVRVVVDAGLPTHLLVNRLPLGTASTFWTLQNGGAAFYAQRIQSRADFLGDLASVGYDLADEWEDRVDSCHIPLYPEHSVPVYSGFYFRRSR